MVITLVMDQYGLLNNGTTATARSFAEYLKSRGHTVRIVTCVPNPDEENVYLVKERSFFCFKWLIHANGMVLAKPDKKVLKKAIEGSDVVHFFLPFGLMKVGKPIADKLGVAATAAFHVQPENCTYNMGFGGWRLLNRNLYKSWKKLYDRFGHVHCPSQMIKDILLSYGYTSEIHAISNGVHPAFTKRESARPEEFRDKFCIMMSGRYGHEKLQEVLLDAASKSKYADKIRIILCGKGPRIKFLKKYDAKVSKNPAVFKFCNREELIDTINYCDLYVHTAEIESEAIACMEAFSCGKVPVISDSKTSATKQFALHPENLFQNRDSKDLARKIDWFIEHPSEKARMEEEYLEFAKKYRLENCVKELETMLIRAVEEKKAEKETYNPIES